MYFARARQAAGLDLAAVGSVLAAGVAYYLASLVGLSLRLAPTTPSVLWPPNAVLTSALLLTSPQRWTAILLAVFSAHLAAQFPIGWQSSVVLGFFATNSCEALLAALCMRRLTAQPTRLNTFHQFGVFLTVVVIMAPVVSTFADAGVAAWLHGDSYWLVWRHRLTSNMLAQLVVTPAVVGVLGRARARFRHVPVGRFAEAVALGSCLVGSGWLAYTAPFGRSGVLAVSTDIPLVVQLPFVLWAALRFGPTGASLSLLTMTLIVARAVMSGGGPFRPLPPEPLLFTVQVFLMIIAVTLLGLAVLIEERHQSIDALTDRLRFEKLLSRFSQAFVQVPSEQMTGVCHEWLGRVGALMRLDCVRLFQWMPQEADITLVSEWTLPRANHAPIVVKRDFPWMLRCILARTRVVIPDLSALPVEAARDRSTLEANGYNAVLIVPLLVGERLVGALAFGSFKERPWSDELVENVILLSEVLANALARRQTDDALRTSEGMKSAILDALTKGVAVIGRDGHVLQVNQKWLGLAEESRMMPYLGLRVGENIFERTGDSTLEGIHAVLAGSRTQFAIEYTSHHPAGTRWWLVVAAELNREERGVVVTLGEVTETRQAEIDAQQNRQALAHVGRVSTMGELTTSLAHQLNQPLTGIMGNAQAARRFLDRDPPDYDELREAMTEIVDDVRRASDVIQRLRELLRRGGMEMTLFDLPAMIRDVARLVSSDAIIRNVTVVLDLETQPIIVLADRVQLQQVLLNLLVNAMEAIPENKSERRVGVSCQRASEREVQVIVRDSGVGLAEGAEELVFDPFYTTKPRGMGMGLSIARSIVETHGGSISARNDHGQGTVVEFTLPLSEYAESA